MLRYKIIIIFLFSIQLVYGQFELNGSAVDMGNDTFRLTEAVNSEFGAIWFKVRHDLNTDFHLEGEMNFGSNSNGADGMVFIMQENCLVAGESGGKLGYGGMLGQSLGIEFDTYQNIAGTGVENNNDPAFDHIAVEKNGDVVHDASVDDITAPIQMHNTLSNVKDGNWYPFEISYTVSTNNLIVVFDGSVRVNTIIDLKNSVFGGEDYTFWGFTSTTGGSNNEQQIYIDMENSAILSDMTICPGSSVSVTLPSLASVPTAIISQDKPVTVSSGMGADLAVDGILGTRWESVWGIDPQWITIDLQSYFDITSVVLVWEGAYATTFEIQTSIDNVNWTTQYSTASNTGGTNTITFSAEDIRYVRMFGIARALPLYGYSLWEFEVYGTPNYVWSPDDGTIDDIYGETVIITPNSSQTYQVSIPDDCVGTAIHEFDIILNTSPIQFFR